MGKEVEGSSCKKENPERKKNKGYLGISFSITSHSMFTLLLHLIFLPGISPQPCRPSQEYNAPFVYCTSGTESTAASKHKRKKRVSLNAIIIFKKGN